MSFSTPGYREVPVFIDASPETLFGVLTAPTEPANGMGVVLLSGGDDIPSTNRNRMWVRVARRLAALGFQVLRLDYRGVGESSGENDYSLELPATEDLDAAIRWFQATGVSDLVLGGSCFGASTCVARAASLPGLRGLALISSPVVRTSPIVANMPVGLFVKRMRRRKPVRGLLRFDNPKVQADSLRVVRTGLGLAWAAVRSGFRPSRSEWASNDFVDAIVDLPRRGVPLLIVYGDADPEYGEFMDAMGDHLQDLDEQERAAVRLSVLPGEVHAFADVELQDTVEEEIAHFCANLAGARPHRLEVSVSGPLHPAATYGDASQPR